MHHCWKEKNPPSRSCLEGLTRPWNHGTMQAHCRRSIGGYGYGIRIRIRRMTDVASCLFALACCAVCVFINSSATDEWCLSEIPVSRLLYCYVRVLVLPRLSQAGEEISVDISGSSSCRDHGICKERSRGVRVPSPFFPHEPFQPRLPETSPFDRGTGVWGGLFGYLAGTCRDIARKKTMERRSGWSHSAVELLPLGLTVLTASVSSCWLVFRHDR
ncbi:hypothetical protein N658DRAFT_187907 [Parathielavia hyrcaniae]|uniref:Transmembrane protein n=1 Tax=Parathielavia hyrcaniae TaxID=113614 RepID=A0AAN6T598_9PEZI|nr:hypothetical protein N658DRAFT_187907 [Parathielavia hyrcaniae]